MQIMGKPLDYWIDVQTQIDSLNMGAQMDRNLLQKKEIYELRAKVSYYESKIQDMGNFMKLNLEVSNGII